MKPTVKERIQLHLFDHRRSDDAYVAPIEISQKGIAQAVWIDIHHVTQYVRPLMEKGLIVEQVAHVKGGQRRRKVYSLTDRGRLEAYRLREKIKSETVRVRDAEGIHEENVAEVLQRSGGRVKILSLLRQDQQTGVVDLTLVEAARPSEFVEMLSDAPAIVDFVGRRQELKTLTGKSGIGRTFVIRGVAGIGKSTLAAKACSIQHGTRNLFWHRVRSWDTPRSMLGALGTFLAALGRPGVAHTLSREAEEAPRVLREDLLDIPATLVIDDAHAGGRDVASLLAFLKDIVAESEDLTAFVLSRRKVPFYDRRDVLLENQVVELSLEGLRPEDVKTFVSTTGGEGTWVETGGALARHPLFMKLLLSASKSAHPAKNLRSISEFIEEVIYSELDEKERVMMMVASLYEVPVPREAFFVNEQMSHEVFLVLSDRSLILPVEAEGYEAHDTVRDFFRSILTPRERGELGQFALDQLQSLAEESLKTLNAVAGVRYLSNAMELSPPIERRAPLLEALGDARELLGDLEGSLSAYTEAMATTSEREFLARLHRKRAAALVIRGEVGKAMDEIEGGYVLLSGWETLEQGWLDMVKCHAMASSWEWEEGREHGQAALRIFRKFQTKSGVAQASLELAKIEIDAPDGDSNTARELLTETLELARELEDPEFEASVHIAFAHLLIYRDIDIEKAAEHMEAVEAAFDSLKDAHRRRAYLMLGGWFNLWLKSNFDAAEEFFERAEALGRKSHSPATISFAGYGLGSVAYYRDDISTARTRFQAFASQVTELGNIGYAIEALCRLGECCLLEKDVAGFRRVVLKVDAPEMARGRESRPAFAGIVKGLDLLIRGRTNESRTTFEIAMDEGRKEFEVETAYPRFIYSVALRVMGEVRESEVQLAIVKEVLRAYLRRAELGVLEDRATRLNKVLTAKPGDD